MSTDENPAKSQTGTYQSYHARYCENCGQVHDASDELEDELEEPVHRVHILEAIGGVEDEEIHEMTAVEDGTCECSGQIVQRAYFVGEVPEMEYDPDPEEIKGRDPDDDALVDFGDGYEEAREVPWLEDGGSA